jgi:hypothetical protein
MKMTPLRSGDLSVCGSGAIKLGCASDYDFTSRQSQPEMRPRAVGHDPRVGVVVIDLSRPAERVLALYNQRGTAEQWIKEGTEVIRSTLLPHFKHGGRRQDANLHLGTVTRRQAGH